MTAVTMLDIELALGITNRIRIAVVQAVASMRLLIIRTILAGPILLSTTLYLRHHYSVQAFLLTFLLISITGELGCPF